MRGYLHELAGADPREDELWLGSAPEDIDKLTGQWERDVVGPTSGLSDLMYKSVGIRDARHSLQLGLSMWRLSWITFIFLPLTFTVGFFGMNVSTFADPMPNIKWWFITSIPVLLVVIVLWYGVKHNLSSQRQNPLRRGVYEALYHDLATEYSTLWTRKGPRPGVVPVGWWGALRWRLVTRWFGADKLILRANYDPATEEFGVWSRAKRFLARRWLAQLVVFPVSTLQLQAQHDAHKHHDDNTGSSAVADLLSIATPVAIAELDPMAASRMRARVPVERFRTLSPTRSEGGGSGSEGRPGSGGRSGGVMVEEKGASEDERSGDEEGRERRRRMLNVPFEG